MAVLIASGCGGGEQAAPERQVRGAGYVFSAPADWQVVRRDREVNVSKGVRLVSVTRFRLLRAYRPGLWEVVVPELDRTAAAIARQQSGTVSNPQTVTIAGRRARRYDVEYEHEGRELVERIAFVLRGRTEYLLLCRYESGGGAGACERLLRSFRLAAA